MILEKVKETNALRSKEREFHGLEREFIYHQERILKEYEESKDLKHPRDIGSAREAILRKFLLNSGYMPKIYGISETSARVISPSGHSSNEIDILFYDTANTISLMNRQGVYDAYPIESVHGVIQVKSKLTKEEIKKGLNNIASFKKLHSLCPPDSFVPSGFGLLFAYDSEMEWSDIIKEIKNYSDKANKVTWCNAVFILSKGIIFHGTESHITFGNRKINEISSSLVMHGSPDHQNSCLYSFYSILRSLLSESSTHEVNINQYFKLPLITGKYSYEFVNGFVSELDRCDKHGAFNKRISEENIEKILALVRNVTPINWIKATDIAYGKNGDNDEQYEKQPRNVRIYNPDNLPFSSILIDQNTQYKPLAFEAVYCSGMEVWIPYIYLIKENLLEPCPKCRKMKTSK